MSEMDAARDAGQGPRIWACQLSGYKVSAQSLVRLIRHTVE